MKCINMILEKIENRISTSMTLHLVEYEYSFIQLTPTHNHREITKSCKKIYSSSDTQRIYKLAYYIIMNFSKTAFILYEKYFF